MEFSVLLDVLDMKYTVDSPVIFIIQHFRLGIAENQQTAACQTLDVGISLIIFAFINIIDTYSCNVHVYEMISDRKKSNNK